MMTFTFDMADIVFINFVASSATNEGWPIEVGIAWLANDAIHSWSSVIRPETHWTSGWSASMIEACGIPEDDLFGGPPAAVVANEYSRRINASGKIAVSEADEWDATMARKLLATIGSWPGLIVNFRTFVASACQGDIQAMDEVYAMYRTLPVHTRAGPDAVDLLTALRHGMKAIGRDTTASSHLPPRTLPVPPDADEASK